MTTTDASKLIILLFHGARHLENHELLPNIVDAFRSALGYDYIDYAFLSESFLPSLENVIQKYLDVISMGSLEIYPIFLLPGQHTLHDIPLLVTQLKRQFSDIQITLHPAPDFLQDLAPLFIQKIKNTLGSFIKEP